MNFNSRAASISLATAIIVFFTAAFAQAEEVLKVAVANSLKTSVLEKIEEPFKKATGITIEYPKEKGALNGKEGITRNTLYLKELVDGNVEGALASVPSEEWLEVAKKEHLEIPASANITNRVVGRILYRIHANPSVSVKALAMQQLIDVFSGGIKNWKEVGGADEPVVAVVCLEQPAINASFERIVLKGSKIRGDAKKEKALEDVAKAVTSTKGAVTFELTSTPAGAAEIKVPEFGRPITLMTKGRPSPNMEKLVSFIREKSRELGLGL